MKVTKAMLHKDLQPHYTAMSLATYIYRYKWVVKAVNALSDRFLKGKNIEGIHCEEVYVPSSDGEYQIRVRIYRPINHSGKLPVML